MWLALVGAGTAAACVVAVVVGVTGVTKDATTTGGETFLAVAIDGLVHLLVVRAPRCVKCLHGCRRGGSGCRESFGPSAARSAQGQRPGGQGYRQHPNDCAATTTRPYRPEAPGGSLPQRCATGTRGCCRLGRARAGINHVLKIAPQHMVVNT